MQDRDSIVALDVSELGRGDLRNEGYSAYRLKVLGQDRKPQVEFDVWAMRRPSDETFWKCAARIAGSMEGKSLVLPDGASR